MRKMSSTTLKVFLIVVISSSLSGCRSNNEPQWIIELSKYQYARFLNFHFQIMADGEISNNPFLVAEVFNPFRNGFDPFYSEFILVHNEEEAQGFPDNVVVAWPRDAALNICWILSEIERPENLQRAEPATLERFGLTYPLAPADLVYNWREVNEIWMALSLYNQFSWIELGIFPYGSQNIPNCQ